MSTTRKSLSTSLQLGFVTGVSESGENIITEETFARINPAASDDAVYAAGKELMSLYANQEQSGITRIDTYALEAA